MSKHNEDISRLLNNLNDYEQSVTISKGNLFNMKETIEKIELYFASKFLSGDRDSQGNKKFFLNIARPQCGNATKNIDIDRSNIRAVAEDGNDYIKSMIYTAELKQWMKDSRFGTLLNKISEFLPVYGSVILKKVKDEVVFIPIRSVKFDPAMSNKVNSYDIQSPYIIEEHHMQPAEIEAIEEWDKDAVKEVTEFLRDKASKSQTTDALIYEQYAEYSNEELGIKGKGFSKGVQFVAYGEYIDEDKEEQVFSRILYSKKVKKFPYKKLDYLRIEGRASGLGLMEINFDPQYRWTEMENQKAVSMKIGSKHIFQTRDDTVEDNIMSDMLDGDIIKTDSEITPVATEERNLGAYAQEEAKIMDVVRSNSNAFEVITGESLPSGTPFRLGALLNQNAGKLYEFIRENLGLFLEEVITEWVLPEFERKVTSDHIFELFDSETIELIVERDANRRINDALKNSVLKNGTFPTKQEVEIIKEHEMSNRKDVQFIKIVKGYLKFDKTIRIDPTGEQSNTQQRLETTSNFIQLLSQNQAVMSDPRLRTLLDRLAEESGLSPNLLPRGGGQMPSLGELGRGSMVGTAATGAVPSPGGAA